jgi:hypothetical protein
MNTARTRTQYRLTVFRETDEGTLWRKSKTFFSRPALNSYIGMISSAEPWRYVREFVGLGPDDVACRYNKEAEGCGCDICASGKTVRQECDERREKLWPVVGFEVYVRKVSTTPWNTAPSGLVTVETPLVPHGSRPGVWGES